LIDSMAGLESHLAQGERAAAPGLHPALALDDWLGLGHDADPASHERARELGLPLVRLDSLRPEPDALALLDPQLARTLRAVPICVRGGAVAVAMENPATHQAQSVLGFLSRHRVVPLVASAADIREAIARCYDQTEDRRVALQLGLDPGGWRRDRLRTGSIAPGASSRSSSWCTG
jgi:type IV pilus assembly protein PilB